MNVRSLAAICFAFLALVAWTSAAAQESSAHPKPKDYDQWRLALQAEAATDAESITALPGFEVELIRSARPGEGSWIAMAFDPQGRLTISREDVGLLRMVVPDIEIDPRHEPPRPPAPVEQSDAEEPTDEAVLLIEHDPFHLRPVESTLKECRGLLYAYNALYANANNSKGFYRLRDRDDDGQFEEVTLLKSTPGGVGHGRNDLTLGPDGLIYIIHGNDVRLPKDHDRAGSPYQHYAVDTLLPCEWNKYLFNAGATVPAGHVIRTDAEGKRWELVCGGMRNPYGIAFNDDGQMFTYDADMEWDAGAPWYRPTRVHHLTSGAEYGWRQGTGKWPAFYPDSLPANADIGLGSPTAVLFGRGAEFPQTYQDALYILEWAYGRILAVHLTPDGSSYQCEPEEFLKGQPLNVTDAAIGPDGHFYFITGGRKTQSGLYRVKHVGPVGPTGPEAETDGSSLSGRGGGEGRDDDRATDDDDRTTHEESNAPSPILSQREREREEAAIARAERKRLEKFHGRTDPKAVDAAWPSLGSDDLWLRAAARTAIEHQPAESWRDRAIKEGDATASLTALMALARVDQKATQPRIVKRLGKFDWETLTAEQRIAWLRCWQLTFIRMGHPDEETSRAVLKHLRSHYPNDDYRANRLLVELLVYLGDAGAVEQAVAMLDGGTSTTEKLHLLFTLRNCDNGWTQQSRETYFHWLRKARAFPGAHYIPRFVHYIEQDALARLDENERRQMDKILKMQAVEAAPLEDRPHVKDWKLIDFVFELDKVDKDRDLEQGQKMFTAARCAQCHRLGDVGKPIGPDLAAVRKRMSRRDVLVSLLSPSKVVAEKYRQTNFTTTGGKQVTGVIVKEDDATITVAVDPTDPMKLVTLKRVEIESQRESPTSPMPDKLLNTLTMEEILDLMAFLESQSQE